MTKDPFPVPFSKAPLLPDTNPAGQNAPSVATHQEPLPKYHDTSVIKDEFPVLFPKAPSLPDTSQAGHNSRSVVSHQGPLPEVNEYRSRKASRDPLTSVAGASKITKTRRKKAKMISAMNNHPPQSNSEDTYTEDNLLKLLMYRRKQRQQELEYFQATQQQKEAEIQQLRDKSSTLYIQLQEMAQREAQ